MSYRIEREPVGFDSIWILWKDGKKVAESFSEARIYSMIPTEKDLEAEIVKLKQKIEYLREDNHRLVEQRNKVQKDYMIISGINESTI